MAFADSPSSPTKGPELAPPAQEKNDDTNADAEKNFDLKSPKFWIIIVSLYVAIFLVALDRLIIVTAIPSITDEFHSIQDIGWYGSAYMLTGAIFNPLFGRIYQLYSTKWVFLISIVIFEAGSALCGAAPSSAAFIVGRAIAGLGSAGIFCGAIMIIIPLVPLRRRPTFTAFFGMAFGVSSVLGPLIGGSFTDNSNLTWRWCFYINLPIGAFTIAVVLFFLHLDSPPREKVSLFNQLKRLDPLGLLFFAPSMICLIIALQWGGSTYSWSDPKIIGLLVTFAVTFVIFVIIEVLMPETAMAPTRVVLNRSVSSSLLFIALLYGAMISLLYYLTTWFQAVQDQSAVEAGIRVLPIVISLVIFGFGAAIVTEKIGYYVPAMLFSVVLCAVGAGMLSTLNPTSGAAQWIGYQVLYGVGIGSGFQTSTLVPQNVLPAVDVPLGMALTFFMQQVGGSVFLSVGQNIFSSQLLNSLSGTTGLDPNVIINTGATALRRVVPPSQISNVVNAYSYALTRVFLMAAALSASMILGVVAVEWKSIKSKKDKTSNDADPDSEKAKSEDLE